MGDEMKCIKDKFSRNVYFNVKGLKYVGSYGIKI